MNKIYRSGVDIQVAFTSVVLPDASSQSSLPEQEAVFPLETNLPTRVQSSRPTLLTLLKRFLRKIAQFFYRFTKPLLRPVATRAKRYLMDDFRQEIRNVRNEQSALLQALQFQSQQLSQLLDIQAQLNEQNEMHQSGAAQRTLFSQLSFFSDPRDYVDFISLLDACDLPPAIQSVIEHFAKQGVACIKLDANDVALPLCERATELAVLMRNKHMALIVTCNPSAMAQMAHAMPAWLTACTSNGLVCRVIHSETGALTPFSIDMLFEAAKLPINLVFAHLDSDPSTKAGGESWR